MKKRYRIHGWYRDKAAAFQFEDQQELEFCRSVISEEVRHLTRQCTALEARVDPASEAFKMLQASKAQKKFDLVIQSSGPADLRDTAKPPFSHEPTTSRLDAAAISFQMWLANNLKTGSKLAVIGHAEFDDLLPAFESIAVSARTMVKLSSGEGEIQTSQPFLMDRYRPGPGSLASWLVSGADREKIDAYLFGTNADAMCASLLRNNLKPGQIIAAAKSSPAARILRAEWDGRIMEFDEAYVFAEPGTLFRDPATFDAAQNASIAWPKISVITVSFNQGQFLEDCLNSVLGQDYPNLEYIVIDAVSTDGSIDILRRYEPRLTKLVIEPDRGQSDGLNKGLNLATGDILTWINSDDMLAPGALRRAALAFIRSGADIVAGGCERIGENSTKVLESHYAALSFSRTVPLGKAEQLMWLSSWSKGDYFYQPEILFTRDIWLRAGGYLKEHLYWAMDWELWIRMGMAGATVHQITAMIGRSRVHAAQKTTAEELYLYQLKNILLEYDDALSEIQSQTVDLPQGAAAKPTYRIQAPEVIATQQAKIEQRSLTSRTLHRMPPIVRKIAANRPKTLRDAVGRMLPDPVLERVKEIRRRAKYGIIGNRIVGAKWLPGIAVASGDLDDLLDNSRRLEQELKEQKKTISDLKARSRDLSSELLRYQDWEERLRQKNSPAATDTVAEYVTRLMYGVSSDAATREVVGTLLANGAPLEQVLRAIAIRNIDGQSSPGFIAARSLMAEEMALPIYNDLQQKIEGFTIIDIGSEPLAFEEPAYAGLLRNWPTLTVGFDPFDKEAPHRKVQDGGSATPRAEYLTLPYFVGSGAPAVFHIACMQPTSSLYPPNNDLAGNFSLLKEAMATVEKRDVATHRLDAVLEKEHIGRKPIDFLKIDVQGGTLPVLEGAESALKRTLVVHLEAEFSPIYKGETVFYEIDKEMRARGFFLLDFANIGRQRYNAFDTSKQKLFHTGRLLWADCVYVRSLDEPEGLSDDDLLRLAIIAHHVYKKYDLAAHALRLHALRTGSEFYNAYMAQLS